MSGVEWMASGNFGNSEAFTSSPKKQTSTSLKSSKVQELNANEIIERSKNQLKTLFETRNAKKRTKITKNTAKNDTSTASGTINTKRNARNRASATSKSKNAKNDASAISENENTTKNGENNASAISETENTTKNDASAITKTKKTTKRTKKDASAISKTRKKTTKNAKDDTSAVGEKIQQKRIRNKRIDPTVQCYICGKILRSRTLFSHLCRHTGEYYKKYKKDNSIVECDVCGKKIQRCSLRYHKSLHTDKTFSCTICSATFQRKDYLDTHMKMPYIHKKLEKCEFCDALISKNHSNSFKRHMATHGIVINKGERFVNGKTEKLEKLMSQKRVTIKRTLRKECQYCGQSYVGRKVDSIVAHLNENHHALLPYYCDWCELRFQTYNDLRTHEFSVHTEEAIADRQPKICEECGKPFARKYDHDRHVLIAHHGRKLCDYCPENFANQDELNEHNWANHSEIEVITCDMCQLGFKCKATLRKHIFNLHTEGRKCTCSFCGKILKNKYTLMLHEMTHTGEKPHKCDLCDASFTQRGDMTKHRTVHFKK